MSEAATHYQSGHAAGRRAGQVDILWWAQGQIGLRLAEVGPYEDGRKLADLLTAVQDRLREVQSP